MRNPAVFSGYRKSFREREGLVIGSCLFINVLSIGTQFVSVGCLISTYENENEAEYLCPGLFRNFIPLPAEGTGCQLDLQ